jgi:hypothetical protein
MFRIPHCLDNRLTDVGKVVSPTHQPRSTPQIYYFSASGTHEPQGLVRPEGLGELKEFIHLIETRFCNLPACNIVPQPTTLPRIAANILTYYSRKANKCAFQLGSSAGSRNVSSWREKQRITRRLLLKQDLGKVGSD